MSIVKTEATGSFFYNSKTDSYELKMSIPCGNHDGKTFKTKELEEAYYRSKMRFMAHWALEIKDQGEFEIKDQPVSAPPSPAP